MIKKRNQEIIKTNNKRCVFCNSNKILLKRRIKSPINKKIYSHYYCPNCEIEFFSPLIFENIYSNEKIEEYKEFHHGRREIPEWTKNLINITKELGITFQKKKILEIGAGDGINYIAIKKEFKITDEDYYVVELDKKSINICKRKGIKHIINSYFNKSLLKRLRIKFDIILCFEVLEHQINPKEFLDACFQLLKEGGFLMITVPNREIPFHRLKEVPGDIPPHHFLRFNKKFFIKNFKTELVYVGTHKLNNKRIKKTSEIISKKIFKTKKLWYLFIPPYFFSKVIIP